MSQPYSSGQVSCASSGAGSSMQADSVPLDWLHVLQSNTPQLLKAQLDFLTVLLLLFLVVLLLPSLEKAQILVNKRDWKFLLRNCFHILGLSSQLCLTGEKKKCRFVERSCELWTQKAVNTQMLPDILLCRSMSEAMALTEQVYTNMLICMCIYT